MKNEYKKRCFYDTLMNECVGQMEKNEIGEEDCRKAIEGSKLYDVLYTDLEEIYEEWFEKYKSTGNFDDSSAERMALVSSYYNLHSIQNVYYKNKHKTKSNLLYEDDTIGGYVESILLTYGVPRGVADFLECLLHNTLWNADVRRELFSIKQLFIKNRERIGLSNFPLLGTLDGWKRIDAQVKDVFVESVLDIVDMGYNLVEWEGWLQFTKIPDGFDHVIIRADKE